MGIVDSMEFFREIDLMLTLCDPNIAQVVGVCQRGGYPGVVTEYLQGSLRQCLLRTAADEAAMSLEQQSLHLLR